MAQKTQKFKFRRLTGFMYIFAGCFLLYAIFSSISTVIESKHELNALEQQAATLEKERDDLQLEIEKLNDKDYVTRYAREHYVFTRDGEKVAIIPQN